MAKVTFAIFAIIFMAKAWQNSKSAFTHFAILPILPIWPIFAIPAISTVLAIPANVADIPNETPAIGRGSWKHPSPRIAPHSLEHAYTLYIHYIYSIYTLRTSNAADIPNVTPAIGRVFWKHLSPRIAPHFPNFAPQTPPSNRHTPAIECGRWQNGKNG